MDSCPGSCPGSVRWRERASIADPLVGGDLLVVGVGDQLQVVDPGRAGGGPALSPGGPSGGRGG